MGAMDVSDLIDPLNVNAQRDKVAHWRIFHCVVEYVHQRLPEEQMIAFHLCTFVALKHDAQRFFFRENLEKSRGLACQFHDWNRRLV